MTDRERDGTGEIREMERRDGGEGDKGNGERRERDGTGEIERAKE